jgi:hypothetical protein
MKASNMKWQKWDSTMTSLCYQSESFIMTMNIQCGLMHIHKYVQVHKYVYVDDDNFIYGKAHCLFLVQIHRIRLYLIICWWLSDIDFIINGYIAFDDRGELRIRKLCTNFLHTNARRNFKVYRIARTINQKLVSVFILRHRRYFKIQIILAVGILT